jgi:hypothetical protein
MPKAAPSFEAVYARSWAVTSDGVWYFAPVQGGGTQLKYHEFPSGRDVTVLHMPKRLSVGLALSVPQRQKPESTSTRLRQP